MIVTENKHEKKFNDARIALILDLLRDYYGPSIPLYQYPVYGTQGNPVIFDLLVATMLCSIYYINTNEIPNHFT